MTKISRQTGAQRILELHGSVKPRVFKEKLWNGVSMQKDTSNSADAVLPSNRAGHVMDVVGTVKQRTGLDGSITGIQH